jgi:steroid 5-alpha reductase family enzyme
MTNRPLRFANLPKAMAVLLCCVAYAVAAGSAIIAARTCREWSPIAVAAVADGVATVVVFAFSAILDNSSVYDPYWSLAPIGIAFYWAAVAGGLTDLRQTVVITLVAVWALRLTWNWLLRWRGLGHEDWRYADFRQYRSYWLVSFAGFHFFPTVAVFLGCLPLFPILTDPVRAFGVLDVIAACLTGGAIMVEMRADRVLREFRRQKRPPGMLLASGIWSWCRHPNYLGEVSFWWGLALFGLAANPSWWWTLIGASVITALFVFISVPMMDKHMAKRYAGHGDYMRDVPGIVPKPLGAMRKIRP